MKTTIKSLLVLMLLVPSLALAQSTTSGTVSELENGFPLPGVNVIIKGSSTGIPFLNNSYIGFKEAIAFKESQPK